MKNIFFEVMKEFNVYAATAFYGNHELVVCRNGDKLYTDEFVVENEQPKDTMVIEYPFKLAFEISQLAERTIKCRLENLGYVVNSYDSKRMIIKKAGDNE